MDKESSKQSTLFFPNIKDKRREWPSKYRSLFKRGLKPVTPQEALKMMQSPWFPAKLVDIRTEGQFTKAHAQGAINVPLLQLVQGNGVLDWSKRFVSYSVGVQPTEGNPEFQAQAFEQLKRNQPIIVVCDRGGKLENIVDDNQASEALRYTSSLKAASELYDAGFKNLFFLEGGFREWELEGLPVEGDMGLSPSDIARYAGVIWIPLQIPLYFALLAGARQLGWLA
jgi:rhodanese-related sulfurtransferase